MNNSKLRKEFQNEKGLYVAEPLVGATKSWLTLNDVDNDEMARMLYFSELKEKKLYIAFVRKNDKAYAKLYITDARCISISRVYVSSFAVNPVRRYL